MQSDQNLDDSLLQTSSWKTEPVTGGKAQDLERFKLPSLERGKLSFSGSERNHLFHNRNGTKFQDVSGISGLDTPQDSRGFAVWDFDRDGWQDIALVNINSPVLSLFRNQHVDIEAETEASGNVIAFKLLGGNHEAQPSSKFGPRDGYGARITLKLPNQTLVRNYRCGEGLAAQNSSTLLFGIGENKSVAQAIITWPSGITQTLKSVNAGSLVTAFEDKNQSPAGSGYQLSDYLVNAFNTEKQTGSSARTLPFEPPQQPDSKIMVYTSVATWCPNCLKKIKQLNLLRKQFPTSEIEFVGIPIDESDTDEKLDNWLEQNRPPYRFLRSIKTFDRQKFSELIIEKIGSDVLPATIIADTDGNTLNVMAGVPTVSNLKQLLAK